MNGAVVPYDAMRRELESADSFDVLGEAKARIEAATTYARRQSMRPEVLDGVELSRRCERRIGELLSATVSPGKRAADIVDGTDNKRLPDGISRDQSSAWQALADVPSDVFEALLAQRRAADEEAYLSALIPKRRSEIYADNAAGRHKGADLSDGDTAGDGWQLLLGRFQDRFADIPPGSVDAIVTDPPYPAEFLDLWRDLGELAPAVLRPGGVLFARSGHLLLPEYIEALRSGGLRFGWVYCEPLAGSSVRFLGRKVAVTWQPWIALSNGDWPSGRLAWHRDTLTESPRVKDRYVWEQSWSVAAELTQQFTVPQSLVLDPFAGSGAYGQGALAVGCRWIGIEADAAGHRVAADRLGALR